MHHGQHLIWNIANENNYGSGLILSNLKLVGCDITSKLNVRVYLEISNILELISLLIVISYYKMPNIWHWKQGKV